MLGVRGVLGWNQREGDDAVGLGVGEGPGLRRDPPGA